MKSASHPGMHTAWFHSLVEPKNVYFMKSEGRRLVTRAQGGNEEKGLERVCLISIKLH